MKTTKIFVYGLVILGIMLLIGSASATITVTPSVSRMTTGISTDITVSLSTNETNVTISGAGITADTASSGAATSVSFDDVLALQAGQITIAAESANDTGSATIIVVTKKTTRRYMTYTIEPELPAPGDEITLTVLDEQIEDALDDVEVDVFLNGEKVAYGVTDRDGLFMFIADDAGDYTVTLVKSRYHEKEFTLDVSGEAATTTTTQAATTTTTEAVTTTTEAAVTTTTEAVTTTTEAVTTTTQPETTEEGGLPVTLIIVAVVIIAIIAFVALKGKGAGSEEAGVEESSESVEDSSMEEI